MEISVKPEEDFRKVVDEMGRRIKRAFRAGVEQTTTGLRDELRQQVRAGGLGNRLANSWRGQVYPRAGVESFGPAGMVFSKAPQIHRAFDEGAVIRSKLGFFLAVPTPAAPKRGAGGKRITPSNFPEQVYGPLRFVYRPGRPSLLVVNNARVGTDGRARPGVRRNRAGAAYSPLSGRATVVMFVLLPQVSLRKRLDVNAAGAKWLNRLPGLIDYELLKNSKF